MIDQGVANALAARDSDRNQNNEHSHDSKMGVRRHAPPAHECTYQDFMKCKPLYFKDKVERYVDGLPDVIHGSVVASRPKIMQEEIKIANELMDKRNNTLAEPQKRTTISTTDTTTTTTTTSVTKTQLKAMIDQGVANALAARDSDRSQNNEHSHDSKIGVRRHAPPARECTYQDFMKCKPLYFKVTKGVVELTQWFKRMETMAYTAGSGDKKPYGGSKPLCPKCNYHHDGQCSLKCHKCNRVGHLIRDCRSAASANTANNQRGTRTV
uniref:Reverse transcriptase domain-containing protein n=1 Tax=Tanacetum cinerariifolium TaxID=118510 RepID=A0A699IQ60_TANCI|nr:reverse transcriptase domain-containing protein [Tanacetum cinerariifolium]